MAATGPDELFMVRNNFFLGHFQVRVGRGSERGCVIGAGAQQAINEAKICSPRSEAAQLERDLFVFRAYLGMGKFDTVMEEIPASGASPALSAVRVHADLLRGRASAESARKAALGLDGSGSAVAQCAVAALLIACEDPMGALKVLRKETCLEASALKVHALLAIDRADLAAAAAKEMRDVDDEAPLAVLASAWAGQSQGRDGANEAATMYRELMDKFGESQQLLTGMGAACVAAGRFEDAEGYLVRAAGLGGSSPWVLFDLVACARHTGKSEEAVGRLVSELEADHASSRLAALSRVTRSAVERATAE
jgi:coatomer subunit epsilon